MWIEGPDVPECLEGMTAWKWVEEWAETRTPVVERIPRRFSRDPHHCGGVWFWVIDCPLPPGLDE